MHTTTREQSSLLVSPLGSSLQFRLTVAWKPELLMAKLTLKVKPTTVTDPLAVRLNVPAERSKFPFKFPVTEMNERAEVSRVALTLMVPAELSEKLPFRLNDVPVSLGSPMLNPPDSAKLCV